MARSPLFIKVYSGISVIVLALSAMVYSISVPYVESYTYAGETQHARMILDEVYQLVSDIQRQLDDYREQALHWHEKELQNLLQMAETLVRKRLGDETPPSPAAKQRLFEELRAFTYGNNDYFWITDYDSRVLSHPDPDLHGTDLSALRDIRGDLIVPPIVEIARREQAGFHSYWWRRLGQEEPSQKLSFFKDFPEYGFVLVTGIYLDDVEIEMKRMLGNAVDRLRQRLRSIKIADTGYVYIFDKELRMLIHPNPNIEGQDIAGLINPATGRLLTPELIQAADNPAGLSYLWDRPSDPGNYVYEKMAWLRYHPDFRWYIASSVYTEELRQGARELGRRLLRIGLAALVVSLLLGWLFARRIVGPVQDLARTAGRVAEGDLSARSVSGGRDEIGALAGAFNRMVEQLRDHIENLDAKVAERTAELEKAYAELQRIDRMKSEFLSSISHELRTPLTSIQGFASLVERDIQRVFRPLTAEDPKTGRKLARIEGNLEVILQESRRLAELITRTIDVSLVESGEAEWNDTPFRLRQAAEDALAKVSPMALEKPGLRLDAAAVADIRLRADRRYITDALIELLDNAVKFSTEGGVVLEAGLAAGEIRLSVSDQGIGIPPAEQERVFERFRQITQEDDLVDKPRGAGLGLTLCRGVVRHYGGRTELESAPGRGARVTLVLPARLLESKSEEQAGVTLDE